MFSSEETKTVDVIDELSRGGDGIANQYFLEERQELLSEIYKLQKQIKEGSITSFLVIQILLNKLNAMATTLKEGIGAFSNNLNNLSGDMNKLASILKNIEAYEAAHPDKPIPDSDVKAFKDAFKKVGEDLKKFKEFVDKHPGPDNAWKNAYKDAQGTFDMISNQKWTNGKTVGQMVEKGDDSDLADAFKEWAKEYNQKDEEKGPTGPFVDWENGAGQAEGLNNILQDLSSDITDSNNTLNQDSQIINSCNSIAQSGVKNTTDLYIFFTQHQIANG